MYGRRVLYLIGLVVFTGASALCGFANSRQDILAANHLGRAFYAPMFGSRAPANMARFTYLDPRARDFFADWNRTARECVAALRAQAGRDPFDRDLAGLVGELSTRCEEFAALWATHDVRLHRKAEKHFHHPLASGQHRRELPASCRSCDRQARRGQAQGPDGPAGAKALAQLSTRSLLPPLLSTRPTRSLAHGKQLHWQSAVDRRGSG
jgi:MmyB-like transcription regulator ligand binding domain